MLVVSKQKEDPEEERGECVVYRWLRLRRDTDAEV
jgi:hypothetical protein